MRLLDGLPLRERNDALDGVKDGLKGMKAFRAMPVWLNSGRKLKIALGTASPRRALDHFRRQAQP
ncbi:hypothetical protein ASE61_13395 [Bosea sp. Root670]|jgi:hypothetical protein|uniref:Uncharacterized protein n=2 Tax=Bosea robiniae TaxID=1036780 RepID=A0ABY0P298_9HYPH|nr:MULTISPECIES: hypothetical protein [Bosea]KRE03456.1 hypothetical protein ASE61_13395 [Bosea sp. Root670]TQI75311.1 hypothetical protein FHT98_3088 [Bosea sp. AK1]SDG83857.1 hypothetical protein SAMN05421844_105413 [Bosea robiniae]